MKYKVIKKAQPGVAGGGSYKYYASPAYTDSVNLEGIGNILSQRSTLSKIDAVAVISGLVDVVSEQLMEGKIVQLGQLGSFRLLINSEGEESEHEVSSKSIIKSKVYFRPTAYFRRLLTTINYKKSN